MLHRYTDLKSHSPYLVQNTPKSKTRVHYKSIICTHAIEMLLEQGSYLLTTPPFPLLCLTLSYMFYPLYSFKMDQAIKDHNRVERGENLQKNIFQIIKGGKRRKHKEDGISKIMDTISNARDWDFLYTGKIPRIKRP